MENTGFLFLIPWLVFAPVAGLLINIIFGGKLSEKVIGTIASLASPLLSTSTVAVRSLSIACTGPPNNRNPTFPVPIGGLIVRRAMPAYNVPDISPSWMRQAPYVDCFQIECYSSP